jgi:NAD(P)-dependent dehydrogenase (short-subunit alcohol dehydrogenase family)
VSFIRMAPASLTSVREAATEVLKTVPQIDTLMCNAAIAQVPTQKHTVDGFESMLGTNHYGHFLRARLLFPRIEESKGRIVVVSSLGYNMGDKTIQFNDMNYHQNKTYPRADPELHPPRGRHPLLRGRTGQQHYYQLGAGRHFGRGRRWLSCLVHQRLGKRLCLQPCG